MKCFSKFKFTLFLLFFIIPVLSFGQRGSIKDKAGKKIKKSTLLVVLLNEQEDFEQALIKAMDAHWTFNKVQYINESQINDYKKNKAYSFLIMSQGNLIKELALYEDFEKKDNGIYNEDMKSAISGVSSKYLFLYGYGIHIEMLPYHIAILNAEIEDEYNKVSNKPIKEKFVLNEKEFKIRWYNDGEKRMKDLNVLIYNGTSAEGADDAPNSRFISDLNNGEPLDFNKEAFENFKTILSDRSKKVYQVSQRQLSKAFEKKDKEVAIMYFDGFFTTDGRLICDVMVKWSMGIYVRYSTFSFSTVEKSE